MIRGRDIQIARDRGHDGGAAWHRVADVSLRGTADQVASQNAAGRHTAGSVKRIRGRRHRVADRAVDARVATGIERHIASHKQRRIENEGFGQ